jgi:hypothetical protein
LSGYSTSSAIKGEKRLTSSSCACPLYTCTPYSRPLVHVFRVSRACCSAFQPQYHQIHTHTHIFVHRSTWKATTSPKRVPIHRFNASCKAACFQHKNADNSSFPEASTALLLNLSSTRNTDATAEGPRRMYSKPSTCAKIGL